ncbi:LacI family DNA-binding transcriptional regulator [Streptomyces sp. NPDC046275]|uniref:LacI family DNA-binding transcriptional regulator n=1 Tax=Streptomyces sp. NPDC046275 TaxID=3157201 RepID=UPI0033F721ED
MAEDVPRRRSTLDEVAELAGVSRSVASRVLSDAPHVSRAKREAVERAVHRLGYVPHPTARALATRRTGAAALVVSGEDLSIFADPFFAQVIVGGLGGPGGGRPAPDAVSVGRARSRGYQDAMPAAGLAPCPPGAGDFTESGGAAAKAALAARHPDLDGVFAANDNMGAGALRALRGAGRRVPADVAVVGFDDLAVARVADPPPTTVHQPVEGLGREMARMLVALVDGQDPTPLILPTRLVVRASA